MAVKLWQPLLCGFQIVDELSDDYINKVLLWRQNKYEQFVVVRNYCSWMSDFIFRSEEKANGR